MTEWKASTKRRRANGKVRGGTKTRTQLRNERRELDKLLENVNPKALPPLSFAFWPNNMMLMWLRQHQRRKV